ncbi:hypothetical protein [Streptomyces sp. NBC_00996]|uniref:hypothetical protein n=1 Tax=Streptomyces sp. NBC_00996 TaxID=2903710 RepID=UPI00386F1215|nr:hypothetical protein OG390_12925 [Streptomyces sp. NBC_00996]
MINPEGIPHFTGDLGLLDRHVTGLQADADGIRRAGEAAHTRFQALSTVYRAPEATDLFASTAPVRDGADAFADKVETVVAALAEYAQTVKPIIDRLEHLKVKAAAFVASVDKDTYRGSGEWTHGPVDNDWTKNQDKVDEHTALMNGVAEARAAFEAAEIAAHNKITALVGGTQYMQQSNRMLVPRGVELYGATAETYEQAQKLPWGTPQGLTHSGWDIGYQLKEHVWDGFVVDGVVGTLDGVFTMAGGHGTDQAKLAWEGLTRAIVGGETYLQESSGQKATGFWASDFAQGSKPYAKETGKAFLKWDMWKTNPARASGSVVTFNLLPFAGAATAARVSAAGKAGAGAKAVLTAARIADAVDPVSTAVRATRFALPKISEVTANVRAGLGEFRAAKGPESVLELSDGSTLRVGDGEFTASTNGVPHTGAVPSELSAAERASSVAARPHQSALVGAEARAVDGGIHAGENVPPPASHDAAASGDSGSPHGPGEASSRVSGGSVPGHHDGGTSSGTFDGVHNGVGDNGVPGQHGDSSSSIDGLPGQRGVDSRPSGKGWYDGLSPQQIKDVQVYRANHEDGYFESYYKSNGRRLRASITDESNFAPPHLIDDPNHPGTRIAADDAPPPFPEKYVGGSKVVRGPDTVPTSDDLRIIHDSAHQRNISVTADNQWHEPVTQAKKAAEAAPTPENLKAYEEIKAEHAPFHERMGLDSEAFGEAVARYHVIPEHYPGAKWEELSGPKNGNDQFDQLWSWTDKNGTEKLIVIESKSSTETRLGHRTLPTGFKARQGSKQYFLDIMREMKQRGLNGNTNEMHLYKKLKKALKAGNVEYILVKGKPSAGEYAGYEKWQFDIS